MSYLLTWVIVGVVIFVIWFAIGITLWVKGSKEKRRGMLMFGGFMTLGIIGLIITLVVSLGWSNDKSDASLEIEKQKLQLEKEKFEFEKTQADQVDKEE